jgi:hypothetical protein
MKEYFTVSIEGAVYQFENFKEAFKKYQEFRVMGHYEAILRKYSSEDGQSLVYIYHHRAKCFFA